MSLCYVGAMLASIALLVWGLMEILAKQRKGESSYEEVVSRQIRGFGILLLSQMVLVLGGALCFGMSGGIEKALKDVGKLL